MKNTGDLASNIALSCSVNSTHHDREFTSQATAQPETQEGCHSKGPKSIANGLNPCYGGNSLLAAIEILESINT
jgi:hypothetical protein